MKTLLDEKEIIIKKIKKTKQGKSLNLENMPYLKVKDIYEARLRYLTLTETEFNIWLSKKTFYAEGLDLGVISFIMNLTRERIRQLEAIGVKKLRRPATGGFLKKYVNMHINSEI